MIVETEFTIADSIAIKILHGGAVIRGVGNEVHLHTQNSSQSSVLSQKLCAKVHGIATTAHTNSGNRLIVHGEKECMLLQYDRLNEEFTFKELCHFQLTDWISSAIFLEEPNEFILLTSHSVALRLLYDNDEQPAGQRACRIIAKSSSRDKSTLYCSHIYGNVCDKLILFGGNAFGELLIWQPWKGGTTTYHSVDCCDVNHVELIQRIPAHNGVIFSIDFNDKFNILTTTSDDRSIRFWKRETDSSKDIDSFQFTPIASGYGHVARVFQGRIIDFYGKPYAITVGEDSHACLWKANAELLYKKRLHFGAVIWNFEYDPNTYLLYTVGSTGNLLTLNLCDILKGKAQQSITKSLTEKKDAWEYVAKAKFFKSNMIIGITNTNQLLYTPAIKANGSAVDEYGPWQMFDLTHETFKCTVLDVHHDFVVICGYKRLMLLKCSSDVEGGVVKFEKLFDDNIMEGVIRAFHFLSDRTFLISDDTGKCLYLEGEELELRIVVPLSSCKEPWTTSALQISSMALSEKSKTYLLASNRIGNLLLFYMEVEASKCTHLATIRQPHGALGATMLRAYDMDDDHIFVQSVGHDGSLCTYAITSGTHTNIRQYQRTLVPVAWVEDIIANGDTQHLLGFNDNHFVVWSQKHDFSVQVPCGGGHRSWHYKIVTEVSSNSGIVTKFLNLLFIKNKEMRLHKTKLINNMLELGIQAYRNEWHTRSCNVMKLFEWHRNACNDYMQPSTVAISGGDDNIVKVFKLTSNRQLQLCAELHAHISNVRTLQVLRLNAHDVLIVSGGGRAQLCVTCLNLQTFRIQELINYTLNKSVTKKGENISNYQPDPETRIMACDIAPKKTKANPLDNDSVAKSFHQSGLFIFLACSDGYLRKLELSATFVVVSEEAKYYGCCLLQLRVFADSYLLVAGTDGKLRLFDFNLAELPIRLTHHASGVNAMDIHYDSSMAVAHIITGGDDQSIAYTAVHIQNSTKTLQIQKAFRFANAHTAQVTAIQFCFVDKKLCAYTSGLDQVLNMIDVDSDDIQFICRTYVADTKGLIVGHSNENKRCFIYGSGIQVYELKR